MKYFINNNSNDLVCSSDVTLVSKGFKEITHQEYIDILNSLSSEPDEEESTEQAILDLVEKGYTVYKMD